MAMYEGQALQIAQGIASDAESIKRKIADTKLFVTVDVGQKTTEVAIEEQLGNGTWAMFLFDVSDGIAKVKDRKITDRKGKVIA